MKLSERSEEKRDYSELYEAVNNLKEKLRNTIDLGGTYL